MCDILVVDDETSLRKLIQINLSREGFKVREAKDAQEAWEKIREKKPHLILLDVMLPGKSGLDFLKELRESEFSDIKVIILSARAQKDDIEKGKKAGADGYVVKPFDPIALGKKIKRFLQEVPSSFEIVHC
jgi:two-component system phosphate regulon response regulator PhoB